MIGVFVPFLVVPAVIGSALTLILVNVFPARRTRDILSVIAVLAAGGVVLLFRIVRPERLARPEGFRSLVEFVTVLRDADVALPAERVGAARGAVVAAASGPTCCRSTCCGRRRRRRSCSARCCTRRLYPIGFSKAQESGERWARGGTLRARSATGCSRRSASCGASSC